MTKKNHIQRIGKLNRKEINSVLLEISEQTGVFDKDILIDLLINDHYSKYNNNDWDVFVNQSTEWFDGWIDWFNTKEEFLKYKKIINNK